MLIIFACSVPTKAAAKPAHFIDTKVQAEQLPSSAQFIGAASTYNPFRGPAEQAEPRPAKNYSANSWTAAIQTNIYSKLVASSPIHRGSRSSMHQNK